MRAGCGAAVLGGVRFKYQPVLSGRSEAEDLRLAMDRCDAIVATGDGTGKATPLDKLCRFRRLIGDFPLVVGAGVTAETVGESLQVCDGAIVGSWFKVGHRDTGDVNAAHVRSFMHAAASSRIHWFGEVSKGKSVRKDLDPRREDQRPGSMAAEAFGAEEVNR